jgi:hypothetical protein
MIASLLRDLLRYVCHRPGPVPNSLDVALRRCVDSLDARDRRRL